MLSIQSSQNIAVLSTELYNIFFGHAWDLYDNDVITWQWHFTQESTKYVLLPKLKPFVNVQWKFRRMYANKPSSQNNYKVVQTIQCEKEFCDKNDSEELLHITAD
jgi:hypothetical protein